MLDIVHKTQILISSNKTLSFAKIWCIYIGYINPIATIIRNEIKIKLKMILFMNLYN